MIRPSGCSALAITHPLIAGAKAASRLPSLFSRLRPMMIFPSAWMSKGPPSAASKPPPGAPVNEGSKDPSLFNRAILSMGVPS